ncbi:FtsQ-type POTRA domain-containing protein [Coriobacteriia bacterium Es71-Z0120]|uniref:cell division protein FtsQ/DivIB n=1 Tax=Parvivirga hydrogeniphila TaxID=2939460 RepID=UPI002260AED6|nr:FtsQ-type POTRA domain-containing protein [Parvivirga hydrogeniphila]MCL4079102.1 FtsQ-type POTRA domain-containing protein [Parvivirga hydrogeniphila]
MASSYDRRSSSSGSSRGRERAFGSHRSTASRGSGANPAHRDPFGVARLKHERSARGGPREPGVGDRIAKAKRLERERKRLQRKRRNQVRALVSIALVVASAVGISALARSSVFEIRQVEVVGVRHLSAETVIGKAAVPSGATLLRFPKAAIAERLAADPWVAEVHLTRDFPHTLRIRIVERVPFARVDAGQAIWLIDANGMVLSEDSAETSAALPVVRDVPGLELKPGRKSTSEVLHNALQVLAGLPRDFYSQVRAVSAPSIDETSLITTDNVEIMVGEAVDVPKKGEVARKIMREQGKDVVFIDVRNPDRPVSRGLSE